MFGRIRSEFQFLEGKGQNSNVWKDKVRIPMFGKTKNSNVLTDMIMFGKVMSEFQYLYR